MSGSKNILFIGDSLIEYFDWEGMFPAHKVRNLGISGETVEWLLERLPRIIDTNPRADMVFIMSGINNVAMEETGFIREYREILARLRAAYPKSRIYVHSLLPTLLPFISPRTITTVNEALKNLADESGATYLDIHKAFMGGNLMKLLSPDGIHLSEKGYELWSGILEGLVNAS